MAGAMLEVSTSAISNCSMWPERAMAFRAAHGFPTPSKSLFDGNAGPTTFAVRHLAKIVASHPLLLVGTAGAVA